MTSDLTTTFPEFSFMWSKWCVDSITETEVIYLYEYVLSVYPERFFDILYQKESIFIHDSNINTFFLPNFDFKLLFNCEGVSNNTRKVMWNYLQLILFTILGSVQDKSRFGDTGNMFDTVNEKELLDKLTETMSNMSDFFQNMTGEEDTTNKDTNKKEPDSDTSENTFKFEKMSGMPNIHEIHEHLKGLFDGKIGALAKELAEEITNDLSSILGDEDMSEIKSTQDVMQKLLSNPSKISNLVKIISDKLSKKIDSGDISQEEMMKEATDVFSKMQGMGGMDQFKDMFKGMKGMDNFKDIIKNMGGIGGLAGMMGRGGGIPKNSRIDTNAMNRMTSTQNTREKLKARMMKKRVAEAEAFIKAHQMVEPVETVYTIPEELLSNDGVSGISSTPSKKKKNNKKKNGK